MPQLTQYQKDYVLKNRGLSSSEYDIDNDYNIIQKEQPDIIEQPSITPSQYGADKFPSNTTTPKDSPLTTFGKNLLEDIPSAALGGLGIAAGSAATVGSGGLLSFLVPLLGGLGASYGGRRLQQAIEPESWQKNVQESSAENPKSAIAGGLAAIPFGGFSPNPVNTAKAVGGLGKTLIGAETTLPEIQNLLNVGGGAAISGGINAAQQAVSPQPFSFTDVLKAAGEGALFNDPSRNPIGRKLFKHGIPQTVHDKARGGLDQYPQTPTTDVESTVTPVEETVPTGPSPADIAVQQSLKAFKEAQAELQKAHIDAQIEQVAQQTKDLQSAVKEHQVAHEEPKEFPVELLSEKSAVPSEEPAKDLSIEELPKPNLTEVLMNHPRQPFDYKDSTPKPDVRVDNPRFSEPTPDAQTSLQKEILSNEKIPLYANQHWYDTLNNFLKSKGIDVSDNNQLVNSETKQPVAGKTSIDGKGFASLIETNPLKRGFDTHMHEGFHAFVNTLRHSELPSGRRMIREYDRLTNESPDYQQWKVLRDEKNLASTPEEYQATNEGYQFLKRHLNLQNESPLKSWYNDFKTYIKTRFTKYGTAEDYQRLLDYNLTHGRKTFSEIAGGLSTPHATSLATAKLSEESAVPSKAEDLQRYKEIHQEMMDNMRKGVFPSEEQKQEMEDIKNRHGGSPPKEELLSEKSSRMSSSHEHVKELIHSVAANSELKDIDAKEARNALIKQVDWKDMPSVKTYLESKLFDRKDNESWQYLKNLYDKSLEKPTTANAISKLSKPEVKQDEIRTEPIKAVEPSKPTKTDILPTKSSKEPTKEVQASEFEELSKEDLAKEKKLAEYDWYKIDNTKKPKVLAAEFRERYRKALEEKGFRQEEGFTKESSTMQLLERRIRGLKLKYETLIDKHNLNNMPPVDIEKNSFYSDKSFVPSVLRSEVQRIRDLPHPDSDTLADSVTHFYEKRREHTGAITNDLMSQLLPTISKTDLKGKFFQNTPEMQNVRQRREEIGDSGTSAITLNAKEQKIEDILKKHFADAQTLSKAHGLSQHIDMTAPGYLPDTPSRQVIDTLTKHQGTPEYQQLIKDWNDFHRNVLGSTPLETRQAFNEFIGTYKKDNAKLASHYGPLDNQESTRIPPSFREKSLVDLMSRFDSRVGRRLAYKSEIQDNPATMHLLNDSVNGIGTNPHVKNVLDDIQGVREPEEALRTALGGLVRSAMLGPLTGAKDLVSNFTLGMQHQTIPQSIITPLKALSDISTNIKESFKAGVNRYNISALEMGDEGFGGNIPNLIRRSRDIISTAQGRNFLEKVTRGIAYGQGKLIAMDNLWAAHSGNASKQQLKFLDDFAEGWAAHKSAGQFPPEDLMKVAAKYVESVQGTYDLRGLPQVAQHGTLAPYLALSRWNIEKLNNFDKHVIQPLRAGNLTPLLMSSIGMVIGGEAVNQLVQAVTRRKEKTPNYKELQAIAEEPEGKFSQALLYKAAGLASYSGYAGIVGDLSKAGMDIWFKNTPQGYSNPLLGELSSVYENTLDAVDAMRKGNFDIGLEGLHQVMQDFLQSYRIGMAYLDPEQISKNEKGDKLRDLKLFKSTSGLPVSEPSSERANPFVDRDTKKFKRTDDMSEAVSLLPDLITRAFERANGNIDILHSELAKIKENNYQTMPSPDRMPQSFIRYMNRLSQTQGAEAASERLTDYLLQNAKNKAKSELVPSL